MLRLRVAQYPTDAVRAPGKTNENVLCCFCNAADAVRTCPRPPAFHEAHPRRAAPPPSSKGADHVSRYLMPSTPRTMMKTCIPQNRKNANQMWPLNPVHHRHVTPNKASRAWPPIQVWIPNQTWIGGQALDALFGVTWRWWTGFSGHIWLAFFLFWGIQVFIIVRGVEGIKYLETWSAPLLLGGGAALLGWASWKAGGLGHVLTASAALQKQHNTFSFVFPGALTASVGYWATLSLNIPDFTRYARSQRSQMVGQAIGLPPTMTAFAFIGVAVTSATLLIYGRAIPDPVELMRQFDSLIVIAFATAVIFAAQLTTNMAANVVSPSNDFSNLNPRVISYIKGGLITAVIGVLMMPWKLMESMGAYIFTWLVGYSGLMGAIAGILICDYWVLRKQKLDLAALFDTKGQYSYTNGINWRAIITLV